MTNKSEYLLKISVIGSGFKLKDKLIRSYAEDVTDPNAMTLGVDISTHRISINNNPIKLILVNIAGQEFFGKLRTNYYRGASSCIIVFDKSDRPTFDAVPDWLEEFRKHTTEPRPKYTWTSGDKEVTKSSSSIPIALIGINTKEEDVSTDEGKALADLLDLHYFETSSPTFENVNEIFVYLCEKVIGSPE